jgi:hypothetical protein
MVHQTGWAPTSHVTYPICCGGRPEGNHRHP